MDNLKSNKLSSHFKLTAALSGGITITFSLIYILLTIVAIIFNQKDCKEISNPGDLFWTAITSVYIKEGKDCEIIQELFPDVTSAFTVFVLVVITLTFSVLCLAAASILIAIIQDEGSTRYLNMVLVGYIGTNAASLVVDITTAAHFGKDHSSLVSELNGGNVTDFTHVYLLDALRQGAFFFMSISLKGYIGLAIHWVLIILLIVYAVEHRKMLKNSEHSIHKLGALNAYDQPRRPDSSNNWATNPHTHPREPEVFSPFARGPHVNNGYNDDDSDRSARRTPMRSETNYSNLSYDRSDSWNRAQPNMSHGSRPFSYLEEIKRPVVPAKPPPSPAVEAPWTRRDPWPQPLGPPVPAPDYSPTPRLKSALKPGGYM